MLDLLLRSLAEVCRKVRLGALTNEAEVRSELMRVYRTLAERPEFDGVFIREEEHLMNGRPDARIGAIVVEFETPWDARRGLREHVTDAKIEQARGYMREFIDKGRTVRGMVTNGVEIVLIDEDLVVAERGIVCQA